MIIVVGASKGIGRFLYDRFKANGEQVIGTFNSSETDDEGLTKVDVTNYPEVESWIESKKDLLQDIHLINCAGISYNSFAHKSDPALWKQVIDVNLIGTYHSIRAVLPIMRAQNFGRIINFASVIATKGTPGTSAYSASKAALWGMAKSLAQENGPLNITVNTINMGYSELGMIETVPKEYLSTLIKQIPAGKLCTPDDIFETVAYLMKCSYINGAAIDVNGGLI
jgi:NAD(P)-dependent dehydrogenase (short-subunit alcohol dehydrogenase family)